MKSNRVMMWEKKFGIRKRVTLHMIISLRGCRFRCRVISSWFLISVIMTGSITIVYFCESAMYSERVRRVNGGMGL